MRIENIRAEISRKDLRLYLHDNKLKLFFL